MISQALLRCATIVLALMVCACDNPVAWSHIRGNVPPSDQFHVLLARDLEAEFRIAFKRAVKVDHALLHDKPTQTGVAYPKFYVWVQVRDNTGALIDEGAVRVAAVERKGFDVLNFLSKREINADPAGVERVFPKTLADGIRARAQVRKESGVRRD